jgi:SnoaL-like domain
MDPLHQLLAIEEIKRLKAKYFRFIDLQDWDSFAALFTEDAVMDMRAGMPERDEGTSVLHGPREISAFARETVGAVGHTVHHGYMPEIDICSETSARAIWAMSDRLRQVEGLRGVLVFTGFGHYHDTYERVGGSWLIKQVCLTRLSTDGLATV